MATILAQPGTTASADGQILDDIRQPVVGDVVGTKIDGVTFSYRIQAGDTPDRIARLLEQLIRVTRLASTQGATITIPGAGSVMARVVCDAAASFESRRQEKMYVLSAGARRRQSGTRLHPRSISRLIK